MRGRTDACTCEGLPLSPPRVYKGLVDRDFGTAQAVAAPIDLVHLAAMCVHATAVIERIEARNANTSALVAREFELDPAR